MVQRIIKPNYLWLIGLLPWMSISCYYDIGEEIAPYVQVPCDTTRVSYAADIVPIFRTHCYNCHDERTQFGGIVMDSYDKVLPYVNDGSLLGSMRFESAYSPMPPNGGRLADCDLDKVAIWIREGAPDN